MIRNFIQCKLMELKALDGANYSVVGVLSGLFLVNRIYIIGKIPTVLKTAIQINQTRSLFLPAFHIPITFHIMSHKTQTTSIGISDLKVLIK